MPRTGLTASEIKERAVDATMARMRQEGFAKVRLTDIARTLGLSHAALYAHFKDKSALVDAVSERWLKAIDESLSAVCLGPGEPTERIAQWIRTLHRAKRAKVLNDPELFKAYDSSVGIEKPFARDHLDTMHRQLVGLLQEAVVFRRLGDRDVEAMARVLEESLLSFHHPRLVALRIDEDREPLLELVLDSVLRGLGLKS